MICFTFFISAKVDPDSAYPVRLLVLVGFGFGFGPFQDSLRWQVLRHTPFNVVGWPDARTDHPFTGT